MNRSEWPQSVHVTNAITAEALWRKLRLRANNLWEDLKDKEILLMEYHTPTGDKLLINDVGYYADAEAMLFVGTDASSGDECQVIASPQAVQVVFRTVKVEEHPERRRPGFRVEDESDEGAEGDT